MAVAAMTSTSLSPWLVVCHVVSDGAAIHYTLPQEPICFHLCVMCIMKRRWKNYKFFYVFLVSGYANVWGEHRNAIFDTVTT